MRTEPRSGADRLQRPLRSRFRRRLTASVRLPQAGTAREQREVEATSRQGQPSAREETTMWRSTATITITLALSILVTTPLAEAQLPGKKIPRIGYLQDTSPSVDPHRHEAF